jgi:two-component system chemotaxis response regulator CheB
MAGHDMIAIGGSAGAQDALTNILKSLPSHLPAALFVALHTSPESTGALPGILERSGNLPAGFPGLDDAIQYGRIYVAPPDRHLLVTANRVHGVSGPRENGFRPAVDPLFRSLAKTYGSRVVGVILSGALDDGTFGLMAVKQAGGTAIVQHPYEAALPSMPLSAIQNVEVDHILRSGDIGPLLIQAVGEGVEFPPLPQDPDPEDRDIFLNTVSPDQLHGDPSLFSCPECGGALWEFKEGNLSRFRCHTGHGFTSESLLSGQNSHLEHALWGALRVLQERAALHRQVACRTRDRGLAAVADRYLARAEEEEAKAQIIHQLLVPEGPALRIAPPA